MWLIPVCIWFIVLTIIWFGFWLGLSHQWYYLDVEEAEVKKLPIPEKTWNVKLGDKLFGWLIERHRR